MKFKTKKYRISALVLLVVVLITSFSGCGSENKDNKRLKIICTIFPQYDFVRQIAGDLADVSMLVPMGTESHDFTLDDMSLSDLAEVNKCDLFIYTGGESDTWVNEIFETVKNDNIEKIAMTDIVSTLKEEVVEGMEGDSSEAETEKEEEPEYDEHVWTSLKNAQAIVSAITDSLCKLDPDNAQTYKTNAASYNNELAGLDSEYKSMVDGAARKVIVFADRFPMRYLCEDYGIKYYAAFLGCSSKCDPSLATIKFLKNKIKELDIPVIFYMENSNTSYAQQISDETGAKMLLLHSCHTIKQEDFDAGVTYLSLMRQNLVNLKEALY